MIQKQIAEIQLKDIILPQRQVNAHKGTHGSVAMIGGADGMVGAALLAARAALLLGAGRTYAALLAKDAPSVDLLYPEIMMRSTQNLDALQQLNCVLIGPGLGISNQAKTLLKNWLNKNTALVLDADALNLIAQNGDLAASVKNRHAPTVITPHIGEASRLLKLSPEAIQGDRKGSALQLAKDFNCITILKGVGSLISNGSEVFINTTGNAGLASGG
ncbi:MAG: NAD(P)H-hydrate dehydratase, partial [Methylophilaceae bacterium]|nr:NAD(P)H-hydrate dehydratase [Methylophilaceae bacterium]